ncbi:cytoplasmic dynein 2 intermediate chain 2-like isoform X1 [Diorhabda sublineata]|uniref:cytoplasmic dynein 2 intermediate chain 2-like isoform X1 n=1 Tax=Diorhabda sublineata TaxID=1163346 RepID=UPI0024E04AC8|nr:cytoplasmic dynein 2 intermediate chain 2-like isoform X1 [Diorhabda sublineata]
MFGIKHNECVGFESRWKVKKVTTDTAIQTTEFSQAEKGTNSTAVGNIEIQTDSSEAPVLSEDTDMQKLATWLRNIYPRVKKEIDDANNSNAFRGYRLQRDTSEVECKLLQKINIAHNAGGDNTISKKVSSMTWNQSGKSLAFSCNFEHQSWCHHSGSVFIYSQSSNGVLSEQPNKILKTESCVVCLKFHPTQPSILAGSTFSGSVIVWNIQNEEGDEIMITKNAHGEIVTQLSWTNNIKQDKGLLLVTTSTDGLLKVWKYNATECDLKLYTRYKVKPPLLNSSQRINESPNIINKSSSSIICFDFSKHIPDMFVVGLEGGHIVQCSLLGATELKGNTPEDPLEDPSFKYYEPHEGEVVSVSFSPNRKEMFMSYGTDSEIRIYLIGQEDPAQMIFLKSTLLDLSFVPYQDKLIVGCGLNGFMEIFHLRKAQRIQDVTKEHFKNKITSTCLAINYNKNNLVALGTANGELQLWNVPWDYLENK